MAEDRLEQIRARLPDLYADYDGVPPTDDDAVVVDAASDIDWLIAEVERLRTELAGWEKASHLRGVRNASL